MQQEVVEHAGDAVDHGVVTEDGLHGRGDELDGVDGVVAHHVVVARQHAEVSQVRLRVLPLALVQCRPVSAVLLLLLFLDLAHVLRRENTKCEVLGVER